MKPRQLHSTVIVLVCLLSGARSLAAGQTTAAAPGGDGQQQHAGHQKEQPAPAASQPRDQTGPKLRLEDLEKMALEGNPTLAQAAAAVRAAEGRRLQAGLYPNPVIGPKAEEVSPGPIIRYGEWGGFVEQRIVTAGKRKLSRQVFEHERSQAEATAQAQRYRVLNTVRSLYYEALAAERLVKVKTELVKIADTAVKTSRELANVGQADQPDVLEVEIEAQRAEVGLEMARNDQWRVWRQLAAVVGRPSLEILPLEGSLEELPKLELESAMSVLFQESPELRAAEAGVARSEAALRRVRVEKIPDIIARGGLMYNRELLERDRRPVGREGFFEVAIQIPIFNRNQGAVAAAQAELERARLEVERRKLSLRARLAAAYREYQNSRLLAERYRIQILPRAQKAHQLLLSSFREMAAAYPQVLIAQRNWFQLQEEYARAAVNVWRSAVEIQGLLLMGGLEAPSLDEMGGPAVGPYPGGEER